MVSQAVYEELEMIQPKSDGTLHFYDKASSADNIVVYDNPGVVFKKRGKYTQKPLLSSF